MTLDNIFEYFFDNTIVPRQKAVEIAREKTLQFGTELLKTLKPQFDNLKTYQEKLTFWETKIKDILQRHFNHIIPPRNYLEINYFNLNPDGTDGSSPKWENNVMSIVPHPLDFEKRNMYNDWLCKHFGNDIEYLMYRCDYLEKEFTEKLEIAIDKQGCVNREIDKVIKQINKNDIYKKVYDKIMYGEGEKGEAAGTIEIKPEYFYTLQIFIGENKVKYYLYLLNLKVERQIEKEKLAKQNDELDKKVAELLKERDRIKEKYGNKQDKQTGTMLSYEWNIKHSTELTDLFHKTTKNKIPLIDMQTPLKDFKIIFSAKPINEIINPVRWHDDNATELLYFIVKLMEAGKISKEKPMNYKRLKKCFVKNKGELFTEKFKAIYNKGNILLSENKRKPIDKIIKYLS